LKKSAAGVGPWTALFLCPLKGKNTPDKRFCRLVGFKRLSLCAKLYPIMLKDYLRKLKLLWTRPAEFYDWALDQSNDQEATRFAALTGVFVALELGLWEALMGGSISIVALVTILLLIGTPFLILGWIYLWSAFIKLCGFFLDENLPLERLQLVVAYSSAGLIALGVGFWGGKWLALATFGFQIFGLEKTLKCSRWMAALYVMLPVSMVAVLMGIFTLLFKVF
jgi:hypothetical protein